MERDFMGLNSKEESMEGCKEAAGTFSNGFEGFNNRFSGEIPKSIGRSRSSGTHFSTDAWRIPRAPVQLTIFYGGMVNVYDDISPEKAQAIMLLAGNGARPQAHMATPRTPARDGVHLSQPMNAALSSAVSVGSSTGTGAAVAMDAPKVMSPLGVVMQSAVPQMRGASLARFLEKRKERVMASAPYSHDKSTLDSSDEPGSSCVWSKDERQLQ